MSCESSGRRLRFLLGNPTDKAKVSDGRLDLEDIESKSGRLVGTAEEISKREGEGIVFEKGDVLFGKLRPYLQKSYFCHEGGVCSPEFLVLRPDPSLLHSRFLYYLTLSDQFASWCVARSHGIKMPRTDFASVGEFRLPMVGLDEQARIADFLDRESERLDSLEDSLDRALMLRRELDLAVLREVVGIGRWPEVQLRRVAKVGTGHTPSRTRPDYWMSDECVVPWFTLADVWQIRGDLRDVVADTEEKISPTGLANSSAVKHPVGTVLLSRTASVGFSAIMGTEMAVSQDFMTWTCGPELVPEFLLYALRATRPEILGLASGSTHKTIYMPDLHALSIPLPKVEEQQVAVERIQDAVKNSRSLGQQMTSLIDLSKRYFQSLIAESVSGQIDITAINESQMDERAGTVLEGPAKPERQAA